MPIETLTEAGATSARGAGKSFTDKMPGHPSDAAVHEETDERCRQEPVQRKRQDQSRQIT